MTDHFKLFISIDCQPIPLWDNTHKDFGHFIPFMCLVRICFWVPYCMAQRNFKHHEIANHVTNALMRMLFWQLLRTFRYVQFHLVSLFEIQCFCFLSLSFVSLTSSLIKKSVKESNEFNESWKAWNNDKQYGRWYFEDCPHSFYLNMGVLFVVFTKSIAGQQRMSIECGLWFMSDIGMLIPTIYY